MLLARFAFLALATTAFAQNNDPFAEGVRTTDPLTPAEERGKFHLPPGFEIQLVAAEPELRKPMNMAFDATGRLWVTESREYPFPVKPGEPSRDSIRIFSDFGPDGRARKMDIFADGLDIPVGLYPFRTKEGHWKCIAWSIPNIWLFEDTTGDGKADKREVLFGPLGWERDTHGNLASFRRSDDGWLYGTHGFNNNSTFKATDGSTITLNSGNTWRVRMDGSRVEQHTWGQVNPFGLCWDDRGNLYSADCHSSPIYQLLPGGYYPSFGKPHDGLGFAPQTIQHSHGSTAICAPMLVRDPAWPTELQGHMFIGNVMTSRLNQDAITWHGSSSKGKEMPDFLTCDDPWFRPNDLQWGPDGALYIADFYNRIIGHYEVPLDHPGRDRERGRIWRVVYRGEKGDAQLLNPALPGDTAGLIKELGSTNPTRRSLALNEICDRIGKYTLPAVREAFGASVNALQKAQLLYAMFRFGVPEIPGIDDPDPLVRTHALRIAAETGGHPAAVRAALRDPDAIVRRTAAEALAQHPAPENFKPLLDLLRTTDQTDDHLIYSTRRALCDQLRDPAVAAKLSLEGLSKDDLQAVLDIMPAVPGESSALLRLALFEKIDVPAAEIAKQLPSIIKNAPAARLDDIAELARKKMPGDATVAQAILLALDERGTAPGDALRQWAVALVPQLLAGKAGTGWSNTGTGASPWGLQERSCADGQNAQVISSIVHGEQLTGRLRSAPFAAPEKLGFYLCGHDGFPDQPAAKLNTVRLVDAANGTVLREAAPPRNDVAQRIEWNLADLKGRPVRFEAVDGDAAAAYAWLAVGRFQPDLPELALADPGAATSGEELAANFVRRFKLKKNAPALLTHFQDRSNTPEVRAAAALALLALREGNAQPNPEWLAAIGSAVANSEETDELRGKLATGLGEITSPSVCKRVTDAMPSASLKLQQRFAAALSANRCGTVVLIEAIENGQASPAVLREKATVDRLLASGDDADDARLRKLLEKLPPANVEADKLIAARRASFDGKKADATHGAEVFSRNCAVCHQVGQVGNLVGPQLDGVGSRGLDRILEDVLDPNRNVDRAFRLSLVTLKDGSVISGLFRREDGATLVFADMTGKEMSVPAANVKERTESETSLMPPAFGEAIPKQDFDDLIAYLLSQKATK
ncbi:MAG: PVC-type heme-binding CxxCH protein [Chthoniobacteraceae bacterium]